MLGTLAGKGMGKRVLLNCGVVRGGGPGESFSLVFYIFEM